MNMTRSLNAAVVGLGWWGRQIVESLSGSRLVRVTVGVDPDTVAQPFAETHGLRYMSGLEEALDSDVDAVIIATPHNLHEQQVLEAAEAGKHVFCEKPLALDPVAARRMVEACRSRNLVLGVGHERRFESALEAIVAMVGGGELGTLLHVDCNWSHDLFTRSQKPSWRQDPAQAPAGTLTALGIHLTDWLISVCGPIAEVRALTADRSERYPGNDVVTIQFRFVTGTTGVVTNLAATPFHSRISVFGDRAWVEARENSNVDVPEPATLTWRAQDWETHTRTFAATNTVRANLDQWAVAALGDGDYRFTRDQLIHNVEVLDAIVRSASEDGSVVALR
jgi:predicted dehydrogenase